MTVAQKKISHHFFATDYYREKMKRYDEGARQERIFNIAAKVLRVVSILIPLLIPLGFAHLPKWSMWGIAIPSVVVLTIAQIMIIKKLEAREKSHKTDLLAQGFLQNQSPNAIEPIGPWSVSTHSETDETLKKVGIQEIRTPTHLHSSVNHLQLEVTPALQGYAAHYYASHSELENKWVEVQKKIKEMHLKDQNSASRETLHKQALELAYEGSLHPKHSFSTLKADKNKNDENELNKKVKALLEKDKKQHLEYRKKHFPNRIALLQSQLFTPPPQVVKMEKASNSAFQLITKKRDFLEKQLTSAERSIKIKNYLRIALTVTPYILMAAQAITSLYVQTPWIFWGVTVVNIGLGVAGQYAQYQMEKGSKERKSVQLEEELLQRPDIARVPGTHPRLSDLSDAQKRLNLDAVTTTWAKALGEGDTHIADISNLEAAKKECLRLAKEGSNEAKKYLKKRNVLLNSQVRLLEEKLGVASLEEAKKEEFLQQKLTESRRQLWKILEFCDNLEEKLTVQSNKKDQSGLFEKLIEAEEQRENIKLWKQLINLRDRRVKMTEAISGGLQRKSNSYPHPSKPSELKLLKQAMDTVKEAQYACQIRLEDAQKNLNRVQALHQVINKKNIWDLLVAQRIELGNDSKCSCLASPSALIKQAMRLSEEMEAIQLEAKELQNNEQDKESLEIAFQKLKLQYTQKEQELRKIKNKLETIPLETVKKYNERLALKAERACYLLSRYATHFNCHAGQELLIAGNQLLQLKEQVRELEIKMKELKIKALIEAEEYRQALIEKTRPFIDARQRCRFRGKRKKTTLQK